jgi:ribosome biogenesis GTPase
MRIDLLLLVFPGRPAYEQAAVSKRRRPKPTQHELTTRYNAGDLDEDNVDSNQRFSSRAKHATQNKIEKTGLLRAAQGSAASKDLEALPIGQVLQVYSLFCDVEHDGQIYLCVIRKTLTKLAETQVVVGDLVRFRATGGTDDQGRPEAVVEQLLPRRTVLTRADSFKALSSHPIVANADQMLIVASVVNPAVKWGLVDRMLIAGQSGNLNVIVCLNKIDAASPAERAGAERCLAHYGALGVATICTSAETGEGLDLLAHLLHYKATVLAGHSGVGKSSLLRALQPGLDIRVGEVSEYTAKGRHTTTSARRYALDPGGQVIDTPGVKMFGLWGTTPETLIDFFPDVASDTAPDWRRQSYERILESLKA